jgi:hypothetical protein
MQAQSIQAPSVAHERFPLLACLPMAHDDADKHKTLVKHHPKVPIEPKHPDILKSLTVAFQKLSIQPNAPSDRASLVTIIPPIVMKNSTHQLREEEDLIVQLFQISKSTRIVPHIRLTKLEQLGSIISLYEKGKHPIEQVALHLSSISQDVFNFVCEHLSDNCFSERDPTACSKEAFLEDLQTHYQNEDTVFLVQDISLLNEKGLKHFFTFLSRRWMTQTGSMVTFPCLIHVLLSNMSNVSSLWYWHNNTWVKVSSEELSLIQDFARLPWVYIRHKLYCALFKEKIEESFTVKQYVHLVTLQEVHAHRLEAILEKLDDEDAFALLLTAELQFLDLHTENIGFQIARNKDTEPFFDTEIYCKGNKYSFEAFAVCFLKGLIHEQDSVNVLKQKTVLHFGPLKNNVKLCAALTSKWDLVIFDTDHSFGEGNRLQFIYRGKDPAKKHTVPIRSSLLGTKWATKPLSHQVIQRFLDRKREQAIFNWLDAKDGYSCIPPSLHQQIEQEAQSVWERFSNTMIRSKFPLVTHAECVEKFAEFFSQKTSIWDMLQKTNRKQLSPQEFHALSTCICPRVTVFQKTAYMERRKNVQSYLNKYLLLPKTPYTKDKDRFIQGILQDKATPLAEETKARLCNLLKNGSGAVVQEELLSLMQPTYLSIIQSMYPLATDCLHLFSEISKVVKFDDPIGHYLGHCLNPIEDTIATYLKCLEENYPLKNRITQEKFPSDSKGHGRAYIDKTRGKITKVYNDFIKTRNVTNLREGIMKLPSYLFGEAYNAACRILTEIEKDTAPFYMHAAAT